MSTESEQVLENNLLTQLQSLGWDRVSITDEASLVTNLKAQLEIHNQTTLSELEFKQVLNKLAKGSIFQKAKTLRDRVQYTKDDGDTGYLELINQLYWCKNQYQVTNQITLEGTYQNRYDVTLLVNGLPLVQIELKRRGLEMKEAFNQFGRYERHSFNAGYGLFGYLQMCIISNGVNTKYFAHNRVTRDFPKDFKQTFFWAGEDNKKITQLHDLRRCS